MSLTLLLDSADPTIWTKWFRSGIFHGITTNPTLLRKAGQPCTFPNLKQLTQRAKDIGCNEMHIQAWGNSFKEIKNCGITLGKLSSPEMPVHVKIPITKTGSEAAKELIAAKISVTFTACFESKQVLLAAAIGANYVAPYLGRINDQGRNGQAELITMKKILDRTCSHCKILVASIRDSDEICNLASHGIQIFTISDQLAEDFFNNETTLKAAQRFEIDTQL